MKDRSRWICNTIEFIYFVVSYVCTWTISNKIISLQITFMTTLHHTLFCNSPLTICLWRRICAELSTKYQFWWIREAPACAGTSHPSMFLSSEQQDWKDQTKIHGSKQVIFLSICSRASSKLMIVSLGSTIRSTEKMQN